MLYFAYGSNLNVAQMRARCPGATPVGALTVPNAVLRFRGVADVAYLKGGSCPGGLWEITPEDERALDEYEGYDPRSRYPLYDKKYLTLRIKGKVRRALYYQMLTTGIMPPSQVYLDVIAQGYRDFGLPLDRLERAVEHSWWRKRKTPFLRDRYKRKGMPKLARSVYPEEMPNEDDGPINQYLTDGDSSWPYS